jgi:thiosulfate reductase cytochrome b subunit
MEKGIVVQRDPDDELNVTIDFSFLVSELEYEFAYNTLNELLDTFLGNSSLKWKSIKDLCKHVRKEVHHVSKKYYNLSQFNYNTKR